MAYIRKQSRGTQIPITLPASMTLAIGHSAQVDLGDPAPRRGWLRITLGAGGVATENDISLWLQMGVDTDGSTIGGNNSTAAVASGGSLSGALYLAGLNGVIIPAGETREWIIPLGERFWEGTALLNGTDILPRFLTIMIFYTGTTPMLFSNGSFEPGRSLRAL